MNATCQSLTPQLLKVIDNFREDYQEFREDTAHVLADLAVQDEPDTEALHHLKDEAMVLQLRLLSAYRMATGEKEEKINAKHLVIPSKKGITPLQTQRTFIVAPSPFDEVKVNVQKTDGNAGIDVAICAKYANGMDFLKKMKFIEKGEKTQGECVQFGFTDMAGKILTIHLVQVGCTSSSCSFSLSIEGTFNQKVFAKTGRTLPSFKESHFV